jgi:hypothetical protein
MRLEALTVTGHQRPPSAGLSRGWCLADYSLADEQAQFVVDALSYWQSVQLLERRRNVVVRAQSVDQKGGDMEDSL